MLIMVFVSAMITMIITKMIRIRMIYDYDVMIIRMRMIRIVIVIMITTAPIMIKTTE